jgi:hypothetical protein
MKRGEEFFSQVVSRVFRFFRVGGLATGLAGAAMADQDCPALMAQMQRLKRLPRDILHPRLNADRCGHSCFLVAFPARSLPAPRPRHPCSQLGSLLPVTRELGPASHRRNRGSRLLDAHGQLPRLLGLNYQLRGRKPGGNAVLDLDFLERPPCVQARSGPCGYLMYRMNICRCTLPNSIPLNARSGLGVSYPERAGKLLKGIRRQAPHFICVSGQNKYSN